MIKYIIILGLAMGLISCGSEALESITHEKYYIQYSESGEIIDDNKCSYGGGHNKITFSIGKKAKIAVDDLYTELKENDIASRVGHSYPAVISHDDITLDGELTIDKVTKDPGDNTYGQLFTVSGTFIGADKEEIKFAVSIYNLNE